MGHFLKEIYIKFDTILTDSLSFIRLLETNKFNVDCLLFMIDFKSLNTLIPVADVIAMFQKLVFDFQPVIQNAHFIIDLLGLALKNSIMGTNVAPILANI